MPTGMSAVAPVPGMRPGLRTTRGAIAIVAVWCVAAALWSGWAFLPIAVGGSGPLLASQAIASRRRGVAVQAEADDVVDVEAEEPVDEDSGDDGEVEMGSVFDGDLTESFQAKYMGDSYLVFKSNWTYVNEKTGETGEWESYHKMPMSEFQRRKKQLKQKWRAMKRKLRIKHGMAQKWPNGRYIFLDKLRDNPFTVEHAGEKYRGPAPWHYSPNEIPARERQMRALALKRRLEQQAEETRVARMKELNIFLGKESWRRPWQAKVDYFPPDRTKGNQVSRIMSPEEAAAEAARTIKSATDFTNM